MEPSPRGRVVAHVADPDHQASEHERATLLGFAHRLAALRGDAGAGWHDQREAASGGLYFVPGSTLTAAEAAALGIRSRDDLFGGVVPHAFVATKAISHPLVAAGAVRVAGWNDALAGRLGDAVLPGYTVFAAADAWRAGRELLALGRVRTKEVRASGGNGQGVAADTAQLRALLAATDPAELADHGLVLEQHLEDVRTFSVGQVRVAGLQASYHGRQRLTRNNRGHEVYGGSDLHLVRGGYEDLLALALAPEVRRAVEQARRYEAAVQACYPGFYASRSNYDILLGRDAAGHWRSAVLEQSWRVGGATGPELAALEVFQREPRRHEVRASCHEVFGDSPEPPAGATVYFRGEDPRVGWLTKYTVVHGDVDPGQ